jgi:hypothetical protein
MTCGRESSNVTGETYLGKAVARKASFAKRNSFRSLNVLRFTFHEQRRESQAGC